MAIFDFIPGTYYTYMAILQYCNTSMLPAIVVGTRVPVRSMLPQYTCTRRYTSIPVPVPVLQYGSSC